MPMWSACTVSVFFVGLASRSARSATPWTTRSGVSGRRWRLIFATSRRESKRWANSEPRLAQLVGTSIPIDGPLTDDLLHVLEEMIMLDSTVQRRISILVYSDIEASYGYLERVFGLGPGQLTRDEHGHVVHGEIQAGDGVVWLHPEAPNFAMASPRSLGASTASMAVMVDDVDAHFRHASEQGASIEYEPVDQPYGYREYSVRDNEGGLWSFMKSLD